MVIWNNQWGIIWSKTEGVLAHKYYLTTLFVIFYCNRKLPLLCSVKQQGWFSSLLYICKHFCILGVMLCMSKIASERSSLFFLFSKLVLHCVFFIIVSYDSFHPLFYTSRGFSTILALERSVSFMHAVKRSTYISIHFLCCVFHCKAQGKVLPNGFETLLVQYRYSKTCWLVKLVYNW